MRESAASGRGLPSACGKRDGRGRDSAGVLSSAILSGALPVIRLVVDGRVCRTLVDSGCTDNVVFAPCCADWTRRDVALTTVGGDRLCCDGVGRVTAETSDGRRVSLSVLVLGQRPLGVDLILGMSGITALGGVVVKSPTDVSFCGGAACSCAVLSARPCAQAVTKAETAGSGDATSVGPDSRVTSVAPECSEEAAVRCSIAPLRPDSRVTSVAPECSEAAAVRCSIAPLRPDSRVTSVAPECSEAAAVRCSIAPLNIEAPDYSVRFDAVERQWVVSWKWADGAGPTYLNNTTTEYRMSPDVRREFEAELREWVTEGWLVPYDERRLGPPRGLIPLMAVRQRNKDKVRPVLDYRELNGHITAHTADADVCAEQLRLWRRHGGNVAIIDLRKAYLQLHVDEKLWPYQTVEIGGALHCLTRVGFGLSIATEVMRSVVRTILEQDSVMQRAVLGYVDDLLVDESVISAEAVAAHFAKFGLQCKPPERASDGARVLGLRVSSRDGNLRWQRDNPVSAPPVKITRRAVFSWCGSLTSHLPLCGWLRPAAAWLKRRVNRVTRGWDDEASDEGLREQLDAVWKRLLDADPARGPWCVTGTSAVVWTDASSLALGVLLTSGDGEPIEDACWLRHDDGGHINMAELDAAIRGINLAVMWGMNVIEVVTDSLTVHHWIDDALSGRARLRTKAHGELLIRRRIGLIRQLMEEMSLTLSVTLVRSADNRADALTRVPREWLRGADDEPSAVAAAAAPAADRPVPTVAEVHDRAGHPGVRRTLYFARREIPGGVTRAEAQTVVTECDICQSIDPSPVQIPHGSLDVDEVWSRLAIDMTHHQSGDYLSVIDCGPSRFCLWRLLRRSDAETVVEQLQRVFYERGAPTELLCDNDTIFRSRRFGAFAARWGVSLRFRAAYAPSGNAIVERNHRTVKVIAARKGCSIDEAVHIYNVTPRDDVTAAEAPASVIYNYHVRDNVSGPSGGDRRAEEQRAQQQQQQQSDFSVGDPVWVRRRGTRCTELSQSGVVSRLNSPWVVEVDGTPRHVRDIRHRLSAPGSATPDQTDDEPLLVLQTATDQVDRAAEGGSDDADVTAVTTTAPGAVSSERPCLRRGSRERRPVKKFCCESGYCDH